MLFKDAMDVLCEGGKVVRDSWKEEEGYLVLMHGMKYVWKLLAHPTPNAGNHTFSVDEILADDWVHFPKSAPGFANVEL
jgi:hypothetical protein